MLAIKNFVVIDGFYFNIGYILSQLDAQNKGHKTRSKQENDIL
jgi:hypothetical protein